MKKGTKAIHVKSKVEGVITGKSDVPGMLQFEGENVDPTDIRFLLITEAEITKFCKKNKKKIAATFNEGLYKRKNGTTLSAEAVAEKLGYKILYREIERMTLHGILWRL